MDVFVIFFEEVNIELTIIIKLYGTKKCGCNLKFMSVWIEWKVKEMWKGEWWRRDWGLAKTPKGTKGFCVLSHKAKQAKADDEKTAHTHTNNNNNNFLFHSFHFNFQTNHSHCDPKIERLEEGIRCHYLHTLV